MKADMQDGLDAPGVSVWLTYGFKKELVSSSSLVYAC